MLDARECQDDHGLVTRYSSLLAPLLLVTLGCQSPAYKALLKDQEKYATMGDDSSGSTDATGIDTGTTTASGDESGADAGPGTASSADGDASSTGPGTTTVTTDATTTDAATTDAVAVCGNGVVEDFGPLPEECDDGNLVPDDGCGDTCASDLVMFVSSIDYTSGELQSLYVADAICFNRADDAGFLDPLRFRAWLSDSHTSARDRLKPGRGRLVLSNGLVVADSWQALLAGELQNPIEVTEKMETYHGQVWTGTRPDGTAVPGSEHCADWTSTSQTKTGYYGDSDRVTGEWTLSEESYNPIECGEDFPIYCLAER